MRYSLIISILIGVFIGAMALPMIMIPLLALGVVIWAIYLLVHKVIMPFFNHHNQGYSL